MLYGLSFLLPIYVIGLGGDTSHVGIFLTFSGITTLTMVYLSHNFLHYISAWKLTALGSFSFGIGYFILGFLTTIDSTFYLSALLMGSGWGLFYVTSPIVLSSNVDSFQKAAYFGYLAAFNVLGAGISPIIFKFFSTQEIATQTLFGYGSSLGLIAAFCLLRGEKYANLTVKPTNLKSEKSITLRDILKTYTVYPLIMVLLGACIFTNLMNFQSVYANYFNVNYELFYISFTLSVIIPRFLLGAWLSKFKSSFLVIVLLIIMWISLLFFYFAENHILLYIISASLFGISYGLIYPQIQAIAVNSVKPYMQATIISYFTFAYFIGIFGFPFISGFLLKYIDYQYSIVCLNFIVLYYIFLSAKLHLHLKNNHLRL